MKKYGPATAWTFAALFAVSGLLAACVDLRDHVTVDPTNPPQGVAVQPSPDPVTINDAKREVEAVVDATNQWVEWRGEDIAKAERPIAFWEGFSSAGLAAVSETAGTWAGPFAPFVMLLAGRAMKRREDKTPDEYRAGKEDSYNAGVEAGKALAAAVQSPN